MSKIVRYYRNSGIVNFWVMLGSLLAVASLLALLLVSSTNWSFGHAFEISYASISIFFLLGSIGRIVALRFRAGPVLLDTGTVFPGRNWFIAGAIGYLFILSLDFDFGNIWQSLRTQLVLLLILAYFAVLFLGRFQVCKRGIWLYAALLPWHKIESYTLSDGEFHFQTKGLRLWEKKGYKVPEGYIEAFKMCLLEHGVPDNPADSLASP